MKGELRACCTLLFLAFNYGGLAALPADYTGKPFDDSVYHGGAQTIPGKIECAYYDLGGEGVAYHDTDATNHGSGELNLKPEHQRPHANQYVWSFRKRGCGYFLYEGLCRFQPHEFRYSGD